MCAHKTLRESRGESESAAQCRGHHSSPSLIQLFVWQIGWMVKDDVKTAFSWGCPLGSSCRCPEREHDAEEGGPAVQPPSESEIFLIFIYVTDPLAKYLLRETYWSSRNNGIIICGELILRREDWEHAPLNHNVNPDETDLKTGILTWCCGSVLLRPNNTMVWKQCLEDLKQWLEDFYYDELLFKFCCVDPGPKDD